MGSLDEASSSARTHTRTQFNFAAYVCLKATRNAIHINSIADILPAITQNKHAQTRKTFIRKFLSSIRTDIHIFRFVKGKSRSETSIKIDT